MSQSSTPAKRRQAKTRRAILDAARDMVAERGPDGVSLREIARRIDYSPMALYEYFPNKRALIDAVLDEGFMHFVTMMMAIAPDAPPFERLTTIGLNYLRFAEQYPAYFALISRYIAVNEAPAHVTANTFEALVAAVQACVDDGIFVEQDGYGAREIAYGCWSLVHGMANLRAVQLNGISADWERVATNAIDALLQGFISKEA